MKSKILKKHLFLFLLTASLLCLQIKLFTTGFRLTADDVAFDQFMMNGLTDTLSFIREAAIGQGRIVHFIDLPFSIIGAYYADNLIFRTFYTTLYFSNFILVGLYGSLLLFNYYSYGFVLLVTLILLAFHPLDFFHLSPNSYPFHVTLPVFLILISRINLWSLRRNKSPNIDIYQFVWLLICFLGMMFSEYGFVFFIALFFFETVVRYTNSPIIRVSSLGKFRLYLRKLYIFPDLALTFGFLVLYGGFRFYYPSNYDGNRVAEELNVYQFSKTLLGHIYGGTSIASAERYKSQTVSYVAGLSIQQLTVIALVFSATAVAVYISLKSLCEKDIKTVPLSKLLVFSGLGIIWPIITTVPVALTAKYQSWCENINSCIFIDSRLSYLGLGLLASIICMAGVKLFVSPSARLVFVLTNSLVIAAAASITFVINSRMELVMKDYTSPWERAQKLACIPETTLDQIDLRSIVDPKRLVSYHASFDVSNYWKSYVANKRLEHRCGASQSSYLELFPEPVFNKSMRAGLEGGALPYLQSGWSSPEAWGTWSNGGAATIYLPVKEPIRELSLKARAFLTPSHPHQRIDVRVNGVLFKQFSLDNSENNEIRIDLTDNRKNNVGGPIRIELIMPDAASPLEEGINTDARKLSIGLEELTIIK